MPIYEYQCKDCEHIYELLIFNQDHGSETVCPKCHSASTRKLMSTFAVNHADGHAEIPSCADGSCNVGCHGHCDFDDD